MDARRAVAAAVVALVAVVALCGRLRPRALDGFWLSGRTGALFKIVPTSGRGFVVTAAPASAPGAGKIWGYRGVAAGGRVGRATIGNRRIEWRDGDVWLKQGI